jgi:hypothetical protein
LALLAFKDLVDLIKCLVALVKLENVKQLHVGQVVLEELMVLEQCFITLEEELFSLVKALQKADGVSLVEWFDFHFEVEDRK